MTNELTKPPGTYGSTGHSKTNLLKQDNEAAPTAHGRKPDGSGMNGGTR